MDSDPWHWSVEDVKHFFHSRAGQYVTDAQRVHLPRSDNFLQALQDNSINGETLLTAIDNVALRDECGTDKSVVRATILSCIRKLRSQSTTYAMQHNPAWPPPQHQPPIALPPTPVQQTMDLVPKFTDQPEEDIRIGENAREGEYQVQDAQGRKRRKLDLSKPSPQAEQPLSALAPVRGYLRNSASNIDELFYSQVKFGQNTGSLRNEEDFMVLSPDRRAGLEDKNFQLQRPSKTAGETDVVYNRMLHLLNDAQTIELTRQGQRAVAFLPYRAADSTTQPATVVQFRNQEINPVALKERFAFIHIDNPEQHTEGGGEWEFLLSKYHTDEADDNILPGYGDSDTALNEGEQSSTDSGAASMAEESTGPENLGREEVADTIDRVLEQYVTTWQEEKLPSLEEKKAWHVWRKTKQSRTLRAGLVESAQSHIDHCKERLRKQKSDVLDMEWTSKEALLSMCRNLQPTVDDIEEQHWMIDVWGRKQEPYRDPSKKAKKSRSHTKHGAQQGVHNRLIIPEEDRFSVLPASSVHEESDQHQGDTTLYDTVDEIIYEADDEEYHTPVASPGLDTPEAGAEMEGTSPESDRLGDFIVSGDDSLVPGQDHAEMPELNGTNLDTDRSGSGKNSAYVPEAASDHDDSDELPSPSTLVPKFIKRDTKPSTPSKRKIMSIDLTADSPSSAAPTPAKKAGRKPQSDLTERPEEATASEIDSWSFETLIKENRRGHILIKTLRDASVEARNELHACYMENQQTFADRLFTTLLDMQTEKLASLNDGSEHPHTLRLAGAIYLTWFSPELLDGPIPASLWESALDAEQVEHFTHLLSSHLRRRKSQAFTGPGLRDPAGLGSSNNPQLISSSDERTLSQPTSSRKQKRKREPERSQAAANVRNKASERHRKLELAESQSAGTSQLAGMITSDPAQFGVHINPVKDDNKEYVYILGKIAKAMKPHQISGARFLWLEITSDDGDDDTDATHGCVLAHTMGLGKTMQTIAFLAAVNEAARSKRKAVSHLLPRHLRSKEIRQSRSLRVLILCPPGLIPNWSREIEYWAAKNLGHIRCLDSAVKPAARLKLVKEWKQVGGPLILGYEMFCTMVNSDGKKTKKRVPFSDEEAAELESILLNAPEIVVADEAHHLKNEKTGVAAAAKRFKTKSKIALTGTPMSNDVQEVYALVSWVYPGYLGDPTEFKAQFAEPIKEGLYSDSTRWEQRKSIMRLKGLHEEIKDIVSRANIEALRGSIPPKVEFVIFVSLKPLQLDLYRRYVEVVKAFIETNRREDGTSKIKQVVFMSMLAVLNLLTSHPWCFKQKLLEPPEKDKATIGQGDQGDNDADTDAGGRTPSTTASGNATPIHPEFASAEQMFNAEAAKMPDEHVSAMGLTPESVRQILGGEGDDIGIDITLSSKINVLMTLLKESIAAKDQAIIFTQRLSLLDYLGELFKREGITFGRIDGSNLSKRTQLLEQFNFGDFDVMTVSTKAGGVGLNMQCANRVFVLDSGFNPAYEEQAIGRAYRLGQKKHVYVYRFVVAGTFEANIYNMQLFKTSLAQRVVDKKEPRRNAERKAREYLYPPKEVRQQDITGEIGKDKEVLDKLLKKHGEGKGQYDTMIRDVKTMETLTQEALDEPLDTEEQKMVEEESKARRQQRRGMAQVGPARHISSSTAPAGGYMPPPPPPPSTYAGPSRPQPHPLGGLPSRSTQYQ